MVVCSPGDWGAVGSLEVMQEEQKDCCIAVARSLPIEGSAWKLAAPCETQGYKLWLGRRSSPSCCAAMLKICFLSGVCTWLLFSAGAEGDLGGLRAL